VAKFEIENGMDHKKLSKMGNEEVIEYLTQIKGRWTLDNRNVTDVCTWP
jgi:3-methyladenine DNA glycosylase/8-oxoguanine DNA glycosylase